MGTHDHARLARLSRRRAERKWWAADFDAHIARRRAFHALGIPSWVDPSSVRSIPEGVTLAGPVKGVGDFAFDRATEAPSTRLYRAIEGAERAAAVGGVSAAMHHLAREWGIANDQVAGARW